MDRTRLLILGAGPAGYTAAIDAARRGFDVTLVDPKPVGGTCLNVGCMPTKALLESASLYRRLLDQSKEMGIVAEKVTIDWQQMQRRKEEVVSTLVAGVEGLLQKNGVKRIVARARFLSERTVELLDEEGGRKQLSFDRALIATGSEPVMLSLPGIDHPKVLDSTGILGLEVLPKCLTIVGGGVIGVEFASLFSDLGVHVTLIERERRLLPPLSIQISEIIQTHFEERGIALRLGASVVGFQEEKGQMLTLFDSGEPVDSDVVLFSIGRRPMTRGLGLEVLGLDESAPLEIDCVGQTQVPGIYAAGDCTGGILLAHKASAEGLIAVASMDGDVINWGARQIPSCIYARPEVASVGLTEEEVINMGLATAVGRFSLHGSGKALIAGETEGFVEVVARKDSGQILGVQMVGPHATELIGEAALALRLEATVDELVTSIHAHPTVSESMQEAARAVFDQAIHN